MSRASDTSWRPRAILEVVGGVIETSTRPVRVRTDQGLALLKYRGNRQGNQSLAFEILGHRLARELGIPTFSYAILHADDRLVSALRAVGCDRAEPGPALLIRWDPAGSSWSGDGRRLESLANGDGPARTVVLDTWIRNGDRHPPASHSDPRPSYANTWLSVTETDVLRWCVFDHTHILFDGWVQASELTPMLARERSVFGLFPGARGVVARHYDDALDALQRTPGAVWVAERCLKALPRSWDVSPELARAVVDFLRLRSEFLLEWLPGQLPRAARSLLPPASS